MRHEQKVREVLKEAKLFGASKFIVRDTEALVIKSGEINEIIAAMEGGDEEFGIECYDAENKRMGWFLIILANEVEEVIADYSDNDFCERIWKITQG